MSDDAKQTYRQEKAKSTAAAGVVVGGSRQRQGRREARSNESCSADAFSSCMAGKGYSITP